jgi:hypothetical protein
MAERSKAKNAKSEASRQKEIVFNFNANLRFALLVSLRSAIKKKLKRTMNWLFYRQGLILARKEAN